MISVAITGEIGSGKTTASKILKKLGYDVFEADIFIKELYKKKDYYKILKRLLVDYSIQLEAFSLKEIGIFFDKNPLLETKFEKENQKILGKEILLEKKG